MGNENEKQEYEDGVEGIKPKSKYNDPIKNNSYGTHDFLEERVSFKPVSENSYNEERIVYANEYIAISDFLIEYELKNGTFIKKPKKNEILVIWNELKTHFKQLSHILLYDGVTEYFNFDSTKFYTYLSSEDKQILWEELQERID